MLLLILIPSFFLLLWLCLWKWLDHWIFSSIGNKLWPSETDNFFADVALLDHYHSAVALISSAGRVALNAEHAALSNLDNNSDVTDAINAIVWKIHKA
jgi:hypothetical protein